MESFVDLQVGNEQKLKKYSSLTQNTISRAQFQNSETLQGYNWASIQNKMNVEESELIHQNINEIQ